MQADIATALGEVSTRIFKDEFQEAARFNLMADEQPRAIVFRQEADGKVYVAEPWPKLARIYQIAGGNVTNCGDTIRIEVGNGHAVYRPQTYADPVWICELVEQSYGERVNGQATI